MTQIPIAIATGISESYIILAVGLGFVFNKEKLRSRYRGRDFGNDGGKVADRFHV